MAMRLPAWLCFASLLAAAPGLAQEDATLAALPLDIPAGSGLLKHERVLRRAYRDVLEAQTRVVLSREVEVAASMRALSKADYGESDVTLARVAYGAGTLYALYAVVRLNAEGVLVASGRVVRNDGKQMSIGTARLPWLKTGTPEDASRQAFSQLLGMLVLGRLPAVKEAPPVAVAETAVSVPSQPPETWALPALPPPQQVPQQDEAAPAASSMSLWPYVVVGCAGLAFAAGGTALLATRQPFNDPLEPFRTGGGTAFLAIGGAVAIAGIVLVVWASRQEASVPSVGVSVGVTPSSVAVAFGGPF